MRSEAIARAAFRVGEAYSRTGMATVSGVTPPMGPRDPFWSTGILEFEDAIVLLVSLVKEGHEFSYCDYFSGSIFFWQSQNRNTQKTAVIQRMRGGRTPVLLFARVHPKIKGVTQPFIYCGQLSLVDMQGERPVTIEFQSIDYTLNATPPLSEIYKWRPSEFTDAGEMDRHDRMDIRRTFGQGRQADAAVRKAVEAYGMSHAIAHYEERGYQVVDTSLGSPFDLECTRDDERRRVEVKATQSGGNEVLVTAGEVRAARTPNAVTDLFVVHSVVVAEGGALPLVSGGSIRIISEWRPVDSDLIPTAYRCRVKG